MKKRRSGFVTVEAAVVVGIYLTILGTFMVSGMKLYINGKEVAAQAITMESVTDICQRRRQLELIKGL